MDFTSNDEYLMFIGQKQQRIPEGNAQTRRWKWQRDQGGEFVNQLMDGADRGPIR